MPKSPLKTIRSRLFHRKSPIKKNAKEEKCDNSPVTVTEEIGNVTPKVTKPHLTTNLSKKRIDSDLQQYAEERLRNKIGSLLFIDSTSDEKKSQVVYSKNKLDGKTLVISESKDDQVQVKFSELSFNPNLPPLHSLEIPEEDNKDIIGFGYYHGQSQAYHVSGSPPRSPPRSLSNSGSIRSYTSGSALPPITSYNQYMHPDENENDPQQIFVPGKILSFGSLSETRRQKMGIEYSYSKGSILDAYSDDDDSSILESSPSPKRNQDIINHENQMNINEAISQDEYDQYYSYNGPPNNHSGQSYTSKGYYRNQRNTGCINFVDAGCNSFQDSLLQGVRVMLGDNENGPYCNGNPYHEDDDLLLAKSYSRKSNLDDGVDLYIAPSPSALSKSSKRRKKKRERKK